MNANNSSAQETPDSSFIESMLFGEVSNPLFKLPILQAAVELKVWAIIAAGNQTAEKIASAVRADPDGIQRLLNALVAMKLLGKGVDGYLLPPMAEYYLMPGKPFYMGDFILGWLDWEKHGKLADAIRGGKRPIIPDWTREDATKAFVPIYATRAVRPERYNEGCKKYWNALGVEPSGDYHVLDLACGAAITTLGLASQHPGVRVALQDWPAMLDVALGVARDLGVEKRISTLPGDMRNLDYGEDRFDLIRLGSVTYFLGKDEMAVIFKRAYKAMRQGGAIVIEAPVSDEGSEESERAVLDGPWLYAVTAGGDVYSFSDYKNLLEEAGFFNVTQIKGSFIKAFRK